MLHSILYEAVLNQSNNKTIRFISNATNIKSKKDNVLFFFIHSMPKSKITYFNNLVILNYVQDNYLQCIKGIDYKGVKIFTRNLRDHFINFWRDELGIPREMSPYKHADKLKNVFKIENFRLYQYMYGEESNKYKVALQVYTNSHDPLNMSILNRNLNYDCVHALVDKLNDCAEVFILGNHPYNKIKNAVNLENTSLFEYLNIISKMDLVIGIDSSAGHIASLLNIPTITIWTEARPIIIDKISFRVLRNNISFINNNESNSINTGLISSIAQRILKKDLVISDKIITFEDCEYNYQTLEM